MVRFQKKKEKKNETDGRAARAAPCPAESSFHFPPPRPLYYNRHHKSDSRDPPPASPAPIADSRAPPSASRAPIAVPARSSFSGAMADAIILGTGNAVAHRAVDAVAGPRTFQVEHVGSEATAAPARASGSDACSVHNKAFQECLNGSGSDINQCRYYMNMLAACRRNSGSMMSS